MEQETPTFVEKAKAFVEKNREPIIRAACITIGIAVGFGAATYLANQEATSEDDDLLEEMIGEDE